MNEELAKKVQNALIAIEAVREQIEESGEDDELGFGVMNGVMVPR